MDTVELVFALVGMLALSVFLFSLALWVFLPVRKRRSYEEHIVAGIEHYEDGNWPGKALRAMRDERDSALAKVHELEARL